MSALHRLAEVLRSLPAQQADAARFVMGHPFDAATIPMRSLARRAGHAPATFTRLAQSVGLPGWDALRDLLIEEARARLTDQPAPFSTRALPSGGAGALTAAMLETDRQALAGFDPDALDAAAGVLEGAERVLVAGFRSCHAPALHFHYLYRLFRPEVLLLGGMVGALDMELGSLRVGDAVLLFGFDPYSRDGLRTAQAAAEAGARVVAVVDTPRAPVAEGAAAILTFAAASPSFFPSLTACTALVQALAATLYARAGEEGRARLRRSEARIAEHVAYLPQATTGTR